MKLTNPFRKKKASAKKLQARTVRRPARTAARAADQGYEDEPNVSLSGAFIVVLLLHVVAIGGIFAFTKARQQVPPKSRATTAMAAPAAPAAPAAARPAVAPAVAPRPADPASRAPAHAAVATLPSVPAKAPAEASAPQTTAPQEPAVKESGQVYTVAKGDNPVSIAKKFKVSSADLVRLNGIDDPRKIQIGQKLRIPAARN